MGRWRSRGPDGAIGGPPAEWQEMYKRLYAAGCYDCGQTCSRRLGVGELKILLCRECSQSYNVRRPSHRLLSERGARDHYVLGSKHLAGLPYAVDANPINPQFAPMRLYRWADLQERSIERWGSMAAMDKEKKRRLLR